MTIAQAHQFPNTAGTLAEPLVLVPGFMADARSFMPQIAELGASRPIMVLSAGFADTVEKIVAEAGPMLPRRFALLGHGLGGNIAIEIPDCDRPPAGTAKAGRRAGGASGRGQDRAHGRLHRTDASRCRPARCALAG
jgi:hypothetical protein